MLLADLVTTSDAVAATRSRNAKRDLLAASISAMEPGEVATGVAYLSGEMPQGRIGLGYATAYGVEAEPAADASLTIADVDETLTAIGAATGSGSKAAKQDAFHRLLARATNGEQAFLRALVLRELRQGALEGVMTEAIAVASGAPADAVRRAAMVSGDLQAVADAAMRDPQLLTGFTMTLHNPVQPMLAQTAADVTEALGRISPARLEVKYDGARVQVHKEGTTVRVFTRRLREVTTDLPDVVAAAQRIGAERAILDGEAIGLDADGSPLPFQQTMSRFGSGPEAATSGSLHVYFFDVLLADDTEMVDRPGVERWNTLEQMVPSDMTPPSRTTTDQDVAGSFFDEAVAAGHEGVMVKDPAAPYAAGRRGAAWLKVKPTYTLDLVVIGIEWGSGRRQGWLSNLHLGARDPDTGGFVMLGKTFKGLTDEMLEWQTQRFLELEIERKGRAVIVRPEQVVEIAFDGVQGSSRYPGGMALRFARVKGYRDDKAADQADTIDQVKAIFDRSRGSTP